MSLLGSSSAEKILAMVQSFLSWTHGSLPPPKPSFFYHQGCTLDDQRITENLAVVIFTDTLSPLSDMHKLVILPQAKSLIIVGTVFLSIS